MPSPSPEQHVSSPYTHSSPPPQPIVDHHNRLSRPGPARMMFYVSNGVGMFWVIGFLRTRRLAAHQFLAENSHRLPTSDAGWYLYHRAKNYQVVWRGFKGGLRYAAIGGACAFLYGFIEEVWDQGVRKGQVDPGGSTVAGAATAGTFAIWNRMRARQTWRCLRVGMGLGLISGVLQDSLRWYSGAPPWYVEKLHGQWVRIREKRLGDTKS